MIISTGVGDVKKGLTLDSLIWYLFLTYYFLKLGSVYILKCPVVVTCFLTVNKFSFYCQTITLSFRDVHIGLW